MRRMTDRPTERTPVVLASASPRRQRLISWLGIDAVVRPTGVDEPLDLPVSPAELAEGHAATKARAASVAAPGSLCLGFDTVVVLDGTPLGKPESDEDARRMLAALSGRHHDVITGVALANHGEVLRSFAVVTDVEMRPLGPAEVERWLSRGEHLGCAGAYNIEHHLARVTEDECFQNVAGLPLCHLYAELASLGAVCVPELVPPVERCDATLGRRCRLGPALCGLTP
ncbi:MAG: Maf family protein [Coriobacteriia bacterium]|nr:Maf family protein [Coriobacteriia bacterium]